MRFKKFAAISAVCALALTACTGGSSDSKSDSASGKGEVAGDITFQSWSLKNDRFTPYFEKIIADFEKANPKVKVKWIDQPGDGYEDKILQQANSNELPDVINLPPEFAYKLAQADMLTDLEKADAKSLDAYVKQATDAYRYPGMKGQYAYAWYLGTDLNWYNTDLIKKAGIDINKLPTDLDSLFAMANQVAKATNGQVKMISDVPRTGTLSSAGVEIIKDGKFVFNSPEAVKVVQRYKDAYAAGAMPAEALNADYQGNSHLYKASKTAWTTASAGFASELEKEAPSLLATTVATPRIGHPPLFIQGISVAKNSKSPEAALAFAKFLTSNENQIEFVKIAQGFFPGTNEANAKPESFTGVVKNELQKKATTAAAEALSKATPEYPIQFTYDMDKYLKQQMALAVKGEIGIQEALDKAMDYANKNLQK
ncbi:multiple sugar transport system substrate-binding protein [Arcanobacterium pluranimalium]|uniref:ABC transporter substrate-binding protein n=1 Tax=Arcanobacterium pluranimalium TaxID=108028 RepID=UPI001958DF2D|nr:extracellular solute-binding protein [Arcanobacterium pluranimalium]MBM7824324.1 multiple sugar transport system substrate-binding protein [Arcanobacterium pluranimalium]